MRIWDRTGVRVVAVGLSGMLALYFGFLGIDVEVAENLIKKWGYHFMALTVVWWGWSLVRFWRCSRRSSSAPTGSRENRPRREVLSVVGVTAVLMVSLLGMETLRSKVLYDEYVLQSTAYNMHHFREVATMVRGYDLLGSFVSTDNYLDKRPYFFPFLVSLVHDVAGYRPINAYLLNILLMPVTLWVAYLLGRKWHGWRGGMVALCLLGTLPLFGQNATGSGMEVLNVLMLLVAILVGGIYLQNPQRNSLSVFILSVVLLAQCRYESAIFVLSGVLVVLLGWWRADRIVLPGAGIFSPLLLVPVALHNKVLSESQILWEMKEDQTSRFGWEYVADNALGVIEFWFHPGWMMANSVLLSALGLGGIIAVGIWAVRRRPSLRRLDGQALAWLAFAVGIGANLVLVLFYFWSRFTDPMAARFSLPPYLLMVFAVVLLVKWLDRKWPVTPIVLGATLVAYLGWGVPKHAHHHYSRMGVDEIEWERRFVASLPPLNRLMLTNKTSLVWLLEKTPSILLHRAILLEDRLAYQLTQPMFDEILVSQSLRPTSVDGYHEVVLEERLPDRFELELVEERRFGTRIARISRLIAIAPKSPIEGSSDE
ncbi:glycosyltransferase family 39 protein [Opitutaceae bacterium]|nr:glycosyltransferase family 39 protein [Opitutaceae bacterium]